MYVYNSVPASQCRRKHGSSYGWLRYHEQVCSYLYFKRASVQSNVKRINLNGHWYWPCLIHIPVFYRGSTLLVAPGIEEYWIKRMSLNVSLNVGNSVYIRGVQFHDQVSRAGTSNYITQYPWGAITCPCPWHYFWHTTPHILSYLRPRSIWIGPFTGCWWPTPRAA